MYAKLLNYKPGRCRKISFSWTEKEEKRGNSSEDGFLYLFLHGKKREPK
jgi:hypothetical protein